MKTLLVSAACVVSGSIIAVGFQGQSRPERGQGGQRQGGPAPVYRVEVPESALDVIAGATTRTSKACPS